MSRSVTSVTILADPRCRRWSGQRRTMMTQVPAEPDRDPSARTLQAEHVVGGDAIAGTAQSPPTVGDIAADGADLERRRIRRIPETFAPLDPENLNIRAD